jgi:hypothetical protein
MEVCSLMWTPQLTVGGELNKVAANVAIGRNWAGVHIVVII